MTTLIILSLLPLSVAVAVLSQITIDALTRVLTASPRGDGLCRGCPRAIEQGRDFCDGCIGGRR